MSQQTNNMRVLVIDNYDSFTYNLVHLVRSLGIENVAVVRNDKFEIGFVADFDKVILSPGPGLPAEAGLMPLVVKTYCKEKSILGVCLGHQCLGEIFGATLTNLKQVVHGKATQCRVISPNEPLFKGLPEEFAIGRYHSWVVSNQNLPDCIEVTAIDPGGEIMALRHRQYDLAGVQFHPESVLTPQGPQILKNWLGL